MGADRTRTWTPGAALAYIKARPGDDTADEIITEMVARVRELEAALAQAAFVAEHLHQMIDRETWREHGAEWQGHYEGDHHAVQVQDEIKRWAALSGGSPANEDGDQ